MFTFQCTRCRKKPAIITRGRRVFLCADCATGSLWYDMVGSLMDPDAEVGGAPPDGGTGDAPIEIPDDAPVEIPDEAPLDPWQASA